MPQIELSIQERKALRADAHHLDPVVIIGGDGWTAGVKKETDAALCSHGLIKVRVAGDDRSAREALYAQICNELSCAPIQHIGKLLVLWRPIPEKAKEKDEDRMRGPKEVKFAKTSRSTGRREVKTLRVLGNERVTRGGTVKRAKPKMKSVKKMGRD
ncbi:MAG: YhbY family RNA-binding protein [Brachymonas sp.]